MELSQGFFLSIRVKVISAMTADATVRPGWSSLPRSFRSNSRDLTITVIQVADWVCNS